MNRFDDLTDIQPGFYVEIKSSRYSWRGVAIDINPLQLEIILGSAICTSDKKPGRKDLLGIVPLVQIVGVKDVLIIKDF